MNLSIIIVSWNTRHLLAQCLASVYAYPPEGEFEVFVVDNSSTDGSGQMVRQGFPQTWLIENTKNVGFAQANNQAIQQSRGRYCLLLNSDAVLTSGALAGLIGVLEQHSNAAALGPMLLNLDGSFQAGPADFPNLLNETLLALGMSRWLRQGYYPGYPPETSERQADWIGGACLLLRREAVNEVGVLDPSYHMYVEETDWCYRAKKAGWTVWYSPEQRVIHHGGASTIRIASAMRAQLYWSKLHYFHKHHQTWQGNLLRLIFMFNAVAKVLVYSICALFSHQHRDQYRHNAQGYWQVFLACR